MKTRWTLLLIVLLYTCFTLSAQKKENTAVDTEKETIVLIDTDRGKIKVKLYNDTPIHRDNFIKHVENKLYNGLLFHRVVKQFMIQAGDLNSINAPAGEKLGASDSLPRIPAEIIYPKYFHKAGQLCAARVSDERNPEKESSATQFYIVTGKFYTEMELDKMAKAHGKTFTPEQKQAYMLEGGCPELDEKYTIFGEVLTGMKTVHKIQMAETDINDRPTKDIRIRSMSIVEK